MKKSSFVLLLAGIALVIWIVSWTPTDAPRRKEPTAAEKLATKVAEKGATVEVLPVGTPYVAQDGAAPGLPLIAETAPAAVETVHEKMSRLLDAMHSREAALAYLQCLLDQDSVNRIPGAEIPVIEILDEEELSPEQRQPLTAEEQAKGWVLVVYRMEGRVHITKAQALPVDFIPEKVRAYLTDDDLQRFEDAQIASQVEREAARLWKLYRARGDR